MLQEKLETLLQQHGELSQLGLVKSVRFHRQNLWISMILFAFQAESQWSSEQSCGETSFTGHCAMAGELGGV